VWVGLIGVCLLHSACSSGSSGGGGNRRAANTEPMLDGGSTGAFCPIPVSPPQGTVHGIDSDGRVQVTAAEAWPDRMPEPSVPTAQETADALGARRRRSGGCSRGCRGLLGLAVPLVRTRVQQACLSGTDLPTASPGSG
jgi:hypothetical protein